VFGKVIKIKKLEHLVMLSIQSAKLGFFNHYFIQY
jgi:hypothetical protein